MSDNMSQIYEQHRAAQDKYNYFLLAAAAGAIALSLQRTANLPLQWSLIPLALAVVSWAVSFYCGCKYSQYVLSILYANQTLLEVQQGRHPDVPPHPDAIAAASSGIIKALQSNSDRMARYARAQFRLLILGALFFIAWHITEMTIRAHNPQSLPQINNHESQSPGN